MLLSHLGVSLTIYGPFSESLSALAGILVVSNKFEVMTLECHSFKGHNKKHLNKSILCYIRKEKLMCGCVVNMNHTQFDVIRCEQTDLT